MKTCTNCKFGIFNIPGAHPHCRRYPPVALNMTQSTFPLIAPMWSCAEWRWGPWKSFTNLFRKNTDVEPQSS